MLQIGRQWPVHRQYGASAGRVKQKHPQKIGGASTRPNPHKVITAGSLALTLSTQLSEGAGSDAPGIDNPRSNCSRAAIRRAHTRGRRAEQTPPGGGAYNT